MNQSLRFGGDERSLRCGNAVLDIPMAAVTLPMLALVVEHGRNLSSAVDTFLVFVHRIVFSRMSIRSMYLHPVTLRSRRAWRAGWHWPTMERHELVEASCLPQ